MRGHLLIKDIFNVRRTIGIIDGSPLDGLDQSIGPVFIFELKEFIDVLFERMMSSCQTFQIDLGLFAETDKCLHLY